MALRRFGERSKRQPAVQERVKTRRPDAATAASPLLLAAIGAVVGAAIVLLVGRGRGNTRPRRHRPRTEVLPPTKSALPVTSAASAAPASSPSRETIEDRVLEVFLSDPLLRHRAIDIGASSTGRVELTGTVRSRREATYALTVARGVPAVSSVSDELVVRPLV